MRMVPQVQRGFGSNRRAPDIGRRGNLPDPHGLADDRLEPHQDDPADGGSQLREGDGMSIETLNAAVAAFGGLDEFYAWCDATTTDVRSEYDVTDSDYAAWLIHNEYCPKRTCGGGMIDLHGVCSMCGTDWNTYFMEVTS